MEPSTMNMDLSNSTPISDVQDESISDDSNNKPSICQNERILNNELNQCSEPDESKVVQYCCQYCTEKFSSQQQLDLHERIHEPYIRYQCPKCNELFIEEVNLFKHWDVHADKRHFKCNLCRKKYSSLCEVRVHLLEKHSREDFLNSSRYERSIPEHYNTVLVTNDSSDSMKPTTLKMDLPNLIPISGIHDKSITDDSDDKSSICQTRITLNNELSQFYMPDGPRSFQYCCQYCKKQFGSQQQLDIHERTHKPFIRYQCPKCNKLFKKEIDLLTHWESHVDRRRFVCNICDKRSLSLRILRQHLEKRHHRIDFWSCSHYVLSLPKHYNTLLVTNDSFNSMEPTAMVMDLPILTPISGNRDKPIDGDSDKKPCTFQSQITKDKELNHCSEPDESRALQYCCQYCIERFSSQQQLDLHELTHKPYIRHQCPKCNKLFLEEVNLLKHWKLHDDRRQFKCNFCHKRYPFLRALKEHLEYRHGRNDFWSCSRYELSFPKHYNKVLFTQDSSDSMESTTLNMALNIPNLIPISNVQDKLISAESNNKPSISESQITLNELNQCCKSDESKVLQYCCQYCTEKFDSQQQLDLHNHSHEPFIRYQCPKCNSLFREEVNLFKHWDLHSDKRHFKCNLCPKKYLSLSEVTAHLHEKHNRDDFLNCSRYERSIPENYNTVLVSNESSNDSSNPMELTTMYVNSPNSTTISDEPNSSD